MASISAMNISRPARTAARPYRPASRRLGQERPHAVRPADACRQPRHRRGFARVHDSRARGPAPVPPRTKATWRSAAAKPPGRSDRRLARRPGAGDGALHQRRRSPERPTAGASPPRSRRSPPRCTSRGPARGNGPGSRRRASIARTGQNESSMPKRPASSSIVVWFSYGRGSTRPPSA